MRFNIIIKLHVALQYSMASNVERERESDERREERLIEGGKRAQRERETGEERHARFVNATES